MTELQLLIDAFPEDMEILIIDPAGVPGAIRTQGHLFHCANKPDFELERRSGVVLRRLGGNRFRVEKNRDGEAGHEITLGDAS